MSFSLLEVFVETLAYESLLLMLLTSNWVINLVRAIYQVHYFRWIILCFFCYGSNNLIRKTCRILVAIRLCTAIRTWVWFDLLQIIFIRSVCFAVFVLLSLKNNIICSFRMIIVIPSGGRISESSDEIWIMCGRRWMHVIITTLSHSFLSTNSTTY